MNKIENIKKAHIEVYAESHIWGQVNGKKKLRRVKKKQVDVEYIDMPTQVFINGVLVYDTEENE